MAIEVEENEARAKIEALANKLGCSAAAFFTAQDANRLKGKYFLAFKTSNEDSPDSNWSILMKFKQVGHLCAPEDLPFEDNYWSHAIEKIEDAVKHKYGITSHCKVVLNPNETIDEALIRLDLNCLEK